MKTNLKILYLLLSLPLITFLVMLESNSTNYIFDITITLISKLTALTLGYYWFKIIKSFNNNNNKDNNMNTA